MERRAELLCLTLTIVPVLCTSIDTKLLSDLRMNLRTNNYSNYMPGQLDDLYFRDKYFDVMNRMTESFRNTYMPESYLRRTLRSFETNLGDLTKREKEEYENLQNLQYYGTEIPKKFNVKRLFSPKYFSFLDAYMDGKQNSKPDSRERVFKRDNVHETSQDMKLMNSKRNYQHLGSGATLSLNVPKIKDKTPPSDSSRLYKETSTESNSTVSFAKRARSNKEKHIPMVKRQRRFPPISGGFEPDVCNMDDLEIDISFHEMLDTEAGLLRLTCTGQVVVNKCEGACNSHVKPSVNNYDGFERQCSCCKDSAIRSRTVTLSVCMLGPEEVHGYSISRTIVEPTACSCQECRN